MEWQVPTGGHSGVLECNQGPGAAAWQVPTDGHSRVLDYDQRPGPAEEQGAGKVSTRLHKTGRQLTINRSFTCTC